MLWILVTVYAVYHLINRLKLLRIIDNVTLVYITGAVFYRHAVNTNLTLQITKYLQSLLWTLLLPYCFYILICTGDTCLFNYFYSRARNT